MIIKILFSVLTVLVFIGCGSKQAEVPKQNVLYKNTPALYQKFQAKKSGEELEKEMNKY